MYLCEICGKGQEEMCPYFREHFLEHAATVRCCPEFEPDPDSDMEYRVGAVSAGALRVLTSRCMKKAQAGERVMVMTKYKAAHGEALLRAICESDARELVGAVHICFSNGGEIVIGGTSE